jgi:hypothetical protein
MRNLLLSAVMSFLPFTVQAAAPLEYVCAAAGADGAAFEETSVLLRVGMASVSWRIGQRTLRASLVTGPLEYADPDKINCNTAYEPACSEELLQFLHPEMASFASRTGQGWAGMTLDPALFRKPAPGTPGAPTGGADGKAFVYYRIGGANVIAPYECFRLEE